MAAASHRRIPPGRPEDPRADPTPSAGREASALTGALPPVTALAGAFALGAAPVLLGAELLLALPLLGLLLLPIPTSLRPPGGRTGPVRLALAAAVLAGAGHAGGHLRGLAADCRARLPDGAALTVQGVVAAPARWRRVEVDGTRGVGAHCRPRLHLRLAPGAEPPPPGTALEARGRWSRLPGPARDPLRAGELRVEELRVGGGNDPGSGIQASWGVRTRAGVQTRLERLFPDHAALVSALVLARKEGLDPEVREAFTRSGTAHLLAISGFHVGVVAVLLGAGVGAVVRGRRTSRALASALVWGYVLLIGAPDAAVRAALLLTLAASGRVVGRPVHGPSALASAFLLFLLVDPGALLRPGFQLSFAGAAGLVVGVRRVEAGRSSGLVDPLLGGLRSALAAGVAATLATLPVAAWHFDRVSVVGIPTTLVGTPLVAAAIPGVLGTLALDPVWPGGAAFVAGAVDLLLDLLVATMVGAASWPGAVLPVPRPALVAAGIGLGAGLWLLRAGPPCRPRVRAGVAGAGMGAAVLLAPVAGTMTSTGEVEIRVLEVGQGDAIAVRSPRGRWILVDAGPAPPRGAATDPHGTRVVRGLRRAGVDRLALLVVTHADLDHIGGVPAVLAALPVEGVAGPGRIRGTGPYADALAAAGREPAPWHVLARGMAMEVDGIRLEVLHPDPGPGAPDEDVNDASVVLLLRFGAFTALLTGDAPAAVEEAVARALPPDLGPVELLKVAHHGSRTSSSDAFLAALAPEVAVIPVGLRNRYGHPDPGVLARLHRWSGEVWRTDLHGEVRIRARRDGRYEVVAARPRRVRPGTTALLYSRIRQVSNAFAPVGGPAGRSRSDSRPHAAAGPPFGADPPPGPANPDPAP